LKKEGERAQLKGDKSNQQQPNAAHPATAGVTNLQGEMYVVCQSRLLFARCYLLSSHCLERGAAWSHCEKLKLKYIYKYGNTKNTNGME